MRMVQKHIYKGFLALVITSTVTLLGNCTMQAFPHSVVLGVAASVNNMKQVVEDKDILRGKQPTIKMTSKRLPHENLEGKGLNFSDIFFLNKLGFPKPSQEPRCKWLKYVAKQLHTINDDALHEHAPCAQASVVCLMPQPTKLPALPFRFYSFEQEVVPNLRSADTASAHLITYLLAIS